MTCITHVLLPAVDQPKGPNDWVIDKLALRRLVRPILSRAWPALEAALVSASAGPARAALARLTPSEVTNSLSIDTLMGLATGTIGTEALANAWAAGRPLNGVTHPPSGVWILGNHTLLEAQRMFGPYADGLLPDAASLLVEAGKSDAFVGTFQPNGSHVTVTWRQAGTVTGAKPLPGLPRNLAHWPVEMRPAAHLCLTARKETSISAGTPDEWGMRRQAADALKAKPARSAKASAAQTTTTPATKGTAPMTIHANTSPDSPSAAPLTVDDAFRNPLNALLQASRLPPIDTMLRHIAELRTLEREVVMVNNKASTLQTELDKLKSTSVGGGITLTIDGSVASPATSTSGWPNYTVGTEKAAKVFNVPSALHKSFDFDVPVFQWSAPCQHVPDLDKDYIFRPHLLLTVLYALITGENLWLSGHTGTGKSTLVAQVCARMGWPMARINLDSEITRLDLMGRDVLTQVNGQTITRFEEGILPWALQRPCVLLLDECDFGRPDVMYCLQRVNEGGGITLTEDGGRHIAPHPMFRVVATANTLGQGDETGLYQGARIQSAAFLDRFTVWGQVDAMPRPDVKNLITARVPGIADADADKVAQYVIEHGVAFRERQVGTPVSPRSAVAIARAMVTFSALMPPLKAREKAMAQAIIDRAPETDRKALVGIIDRVWK